MSAEPPRLPPGQDLVTGWPVLHAGDVPSFDPAAWDFRITGAVENPVRLTWADLRALPKVAITADFHCVTSWSRYDNAWEGVSFRTLAELARPKPEAKFVMAVCEGDYETNLLLEALMRDNVLCAYRHDRRELQPAHGGPLRLVVPDLYAWKSAKWLRRLDFMTRDRRGYWEVRGYHNDADPWKEQRYSDEE